jgi:hypothetical protein
LADNITFSGYGLIPATPEPGQTLTITLFWQANGRPSQDYTVFVHLLDRAGNQAAGADGPPQNGDFPTGWWRSGDLIKDGHLMLIPADLPAGEYTLSLGLYDPQTGQRLPRQDGQGDTIRLPVTIGP